jgi:hypothetical protein
VSDYPPTPQLCDHARQRCAEMGISTRRVKRVIREPDLSYCTYEGRMMMCRFDEPDFRVVVNTDGDVPVAVTVVWWTDEVYERPAV